MNKDETNKNIDAAYNFVDKMVERADKMENGCPMWYGWALREAFLAGAEHEKKKEGVNNNTYLMR